LVSLLRDLAAYRLIDRLLPCTKDFRGTGFQRNRRKVKTFHDHNGCSRDPAQALPKEVVYSRATAPRGRGPWSQSLFSAAGIRRRLQQSSSPPLQICGRHQDFRHKGGIAPANSLPSFCLSVLARSFFESMILYAGMIRWNDGPEAMAEIREVSFQGGDKSL